MDLKSATLETAIEFSRHYGYGDTDKDSPKTLTFLSWARTQLTWEGASSVKPTTKTGVVLKDPTGAYGKGFCAAGSIIQISKRYSSDFEVLMSLDDFSIVRLLAVKSTGELVERSRAKFCGVVMGTYSYTTRANGTNTVVDVVGVFDLPENHSSSLFSPVTAPR